MKEPSAQTTLWQSGILATGVGFVVFCGCLFVAQGDVGSFVVLCGCLLVGWRNVRRSITNG